MSSKDFQNGFIAGMTTNGIKTNKIINAKEEIYISKSKSYIPIPTYTSGEVIDVANTDNSEYYYPVELPRDYVEGATYYNIIDATPQIATKVVGYGEVPSDNPGVYISKTPNATSLTTRDGNYENNLTFTDVVTIQGASSIQVTLGYQTEGVNWDWVQVASGETGASSSGTKYGGSTLKQTVLTFENTNTVNFYFKSDSGGNAYLGYYAEVRGYDADGNFIDKTYGPVYANIGKGDSGNYYAYSGDMLPRRSKIIFEEELTFELDEDEINFKAPISNLLSLDEDFYNIVLDDQEFKAMKSTENDIVTYKCQGIDKDTDKLYELDLRVVQIEDLYYIIGHSNPTDLLSGTHSLIISENFTAVEDYCFVLSENDDSTYNYKFLFLNDFIPGEVSLTVYYSSYFKLNKYYTTCTSSVFSNKKFTLIENSNGVTGVVCSVANSTDSNIASMMSRVKEMINAGSLNYGLCIKFTFSQTQDTETVSKTYEILPKYINYSQTDVPDYNYVWGNNILNNR